MTVAWRRREAPLRDLRGLAQAALRGPERRFGHMTARREAGTTLLEVLILDLRTGAGEILSAPVPPDTSGFPSLTPHIPAAHWAERALGDLFGLRAEGHPRWKSLLLHEAWSPDLAPLSEGSGGSRASYEFLRATGEGVHEIPVGPIHAGIIEPGHFRFSCLGEVITNLEIRLGYQHRGLEWRLAHTPLPRLRFAAEAAASDTAAGNALAHATAVEQIMQSAAPPRAQALRTIALEVERLACHVGDLGGLSADIGYSAGSALFGRLRGAALGLAEALSGNRFLRGYILPGGVARDLSEDGRRRVIDEAERLSRSLTEAAPLMLDHPAVIERMEGVGVLKPSLAREFGLVGPAGRASGSGYDARAHFPHGLYPACSPTLAAGQAGDVLARAQVRVVEIEASLGLIRRLAEALPEGRVRAEIPERLPADRTGVGIVEAWRGELIHWITTGGEGRVARYAIKDPSFNNWTGLAIAARGNLAGDFPLCNKSFNLSYSGNDL